MRVISFGLILSFRLVSAWAFCKILASTSRGALRGISLQKTKITSKYFPRTWWRVQSRGIAAHRRKTRTFSFSALKPWRTKALWESQAMPLGHRKGMRFRNLHSSLQCIWMVNRWAESAEWKGVAVAVFLPSYCKTYHPQKIKPRNLRSLALTGMLRKVKMLELRRSDHNSTMLLNRS